MEDVIYNFGDLTLRVNEHGFVLEGADYCLLDASMLGSHPTSWIELLVPKKSTYEHYIGTYNHKDTSDIAVAFGVRRSKVE